MKTVLAGLALALASLSVQADTVAITSVTQLSSPSGQTITSSSSAAFVGPKTITFTTVGKTCQWVGSATAIGPLGCNYSITVNSSTGELSNPSNANSNSGCTQASQMVAQCK